jgi:hypothetical protein
MRDAWIESLQLLGKEESFPLIEIAMDRTPKVKLGQSAPFSGQYQEVGPHGGKKKEVTLPKGHTAPPTHKKGSGFKLIDRTNNKSGGK